MRILVMNANTTATMTEAIRAKVTSKVGTYPRPRPRPRPKTITGWPLSARTARSSLAERNPAETRS
jgi:Asp/Glu/hydantoin racemase